MINHVEPDCVACPAYFSVLAFVVVFLHDAQFGDFVLSLEVNHAREQIPLEALQHNCVDEEKVGDRGDGVVDQLVVLLVDPTCQQDDLLDLERDHIEQDGPPDSHR